MAEIEHNDVNETDSGQNDAPQESQPTEEMNEADSKELDSPSAEEPQQETGDNDGVENTDADPETTEETDPSVPNDEVEKQNLENDTLDDPSNENNEVKDSDDFDDKDDKTEADGKELDDEEDPQPVEEEKDPDGVDGKDDMVDPDEIEDDNTDLDKDELDDGDDTANEKNPDETEDDDDNTDLDKDELDDGDDTVNEKDPGKIEDDDTDLDKTELDDDEVSDEEETLDTEDDVKKKETRVEEHTEEEVDNGENEEQENNEEDEDKEEQAITYNGREPDRHVLTEEESNAVKDRLKEERALREEHPSGYKDFDQGKTNVLTDEPAKLSSKNFDRLAEERGLSPQEAYDQKYSFNEYQKPDPSLNGAEHHPDKDPESFAKVRHVLDDEKAYSYNNGVVKDGYEHASSGKYLTPEKQSKPGVSESQAAVENLAFPKHNDARVRSDATIKPHLADGTQHNIIEGTAAPQNKLDSNDIFKANDGLDRHGGGKQIVTNGGFESGGVTEGNKVNIGDMNKDLNDPNLFSNHSAGEYGYTDAPSGKSAFGQLSNTGEGTRNATAQRTVGGPDRRPDDDGGHLIGARFNGAPDERNLDAQNSNLNRGAYKAMENEQAKALNNGDKVFVNNLTTKSDGSDRPNTYEGYSIVEHPDGSREAKPFTFQNERQNDK